MIAKPPRSEWQPILKGSLADAAQRAVDAIVKDIGALDGQVQRPVDLCERALLFAYLANSNPHAGWEERAVTCLNLTIEKVSAVPYQFFSLGLYGGMAGIGWIIEHVSRLLERDEPRLAVQSEETDPEEDAIAEIDQLIISRLNDGPWQGHYDLINGLTGLGIYFLERLPRDFAVRGIQLVLNALERVAQSSSTGITWFTPPALLLGPQLENNPNGYYNLGVAHGVPGIIQFLGEVVAHGIDVTRAQHLLTGSVEWLLAQRQPIEAVYRFSTVVSPGQEVRGSRLGWCYGDLGIAAVLHQVGNRNGRDDWSQIAVDLLQHSMRVPEEKAFITDAGLCHGAIGVAHILNRVYQTGDQQFEKDAISWFERALSMRRDGQGIGGFLAYRPELNPKWNSDVSFLTGGIGLALTFLSSIYPIEPQWDRLLLLSGRGCVRSEN